MFLLQLNPAQESEGLHPLWIQDRGTAEVTFGLLGLVQLQE